MSSQAIRAMSRPTISPNSCSAISAPMRMILPAHNQGRWARLPAQQQQRLGQGVRLGERRETHMLPPQRQTVRPQRRLVRAIALLRWVEVFRPADKGDIAMPIRRQVRHGRAQAAAVVGLHREYPVALGAFTVEHDGRYAQFPEQPPRRRRRLGRRRYDQAAHLAAGQQAQAGDIQVRLDCAMRPG